MLNSAQISNAQKIREALNKVGLTNKYVQDAVVVIAWKESTLFPLRENCYTNTPNSDIRRYFGKFLPNYTDSQITELKKDCVKFFNQVYGNRMGNSATEGYTYRGRGFIQITGKNNYRAIGNKIGVNLVSNPDLVLDANIGAKALVQYYKDAEKNPVIKNYGASNLNDLKDLDSALKAVFHLTAGVGLSPKYLFEQDSTGGWAKVQKYKNTIIAETKSKNDKDSDNNKYIGYVLLIALGLGIVLFANKKIRNQLGFFK